jgi:hypothetical protein
MTNLKTLFGTTALLTILALGMTSSATLAASSAVVPAPSCEEIRKADETLCNADWQASDKGKSAWLNYKECMKTALNNYLECIKPVPVLK